jgi:hypothetical protein
MRALPHATWATRRLQPGQGRQAAMAAFTGPADMGPFVAQKDTKPFTVPTGMEPFTVAA